MWFFLTFRKCAFHRSWSCQVQILVNGEMIRLWWNASRRQCVRSLKWQKELGMRLRLHGDRVFKYKLLDNNLSKNCSVASEWNDYYIKIKEQDLCVLQTFFFFHPFSPTKHFLHRFHLYWNNYNLKEKCHIWVILVLKPDCVRLVLLVIVSCHSSPPTTSVTLRCC